MSEIKREYAYRCTDGQVYTGTHGKEEAKTHQISLDKEVLSEETINEAHRIFGTDKLSTSYTDTSRKEDFVAKINDLFAWHGNFEAAVGRLVFLYSILPEIVEFFNMLKNQKKVNED